MDRGQRRPLGVDFSALKAVCQLLSTHGAVSEVTAAHATVQRQLTGYLLRIVQLNFESMRPEVATLPEDTAAMLYNQLREYLYIDLVVHPVSDFFVSLCCTCRPSEGGNVPAVARKAQYNHGVCSTVRRSAAQLRVSLQRDRGSCYTNQARVRVRL